MKTININIPEGYEIDVEASDLAKGNIIFKPTQKRWEDFSRCDCWRLEVENGVPVTKCEEAYVGGSYEWDYPTEELLLAAEAHRELLFWRNRVWKEDNNWEPIIDSPASKYSIYNYQGKLTDGETYCMNAILSFRTKELRDQFLKDHKDLIEQAKILL